MQGLWKEIGPRSKNVAVLCALPVRSRKSAQQHELLAWWHKYKVHARRCDGGKREAKGVEGLTSASTSIDESSL